MALLFCMVAIVPGCGSDDGSAPPSADVRERLDALVAESDGPPGAIVVVQRGDDVDVYTAGVGEIGNATPIDVDDHMRVASVAKAFSGAAAIAIVADGLMTLDDTIGRWRPDLPTSWHGITLRQLLNHTSGIDDFADSEEFFEDFVESLDVAPPPTVLLSYVDDPPAFAPGSRYRYSNSDNIVVGLMIEAATGQPYETVLASRVYQPLGLANTSLPAGSDLADPFIHGYELGSPTLDVSELFAAGWTWASGGIVSSPADATRFVRGYVGGVLTDTATHAAQFTFIEGARSDPPGPGENSAGLAVFRYETRCGTVYGHTGNTAGYTQFIAASEDGDRSATVSINIQLAPRTNQARFDDLRTLFESAVCAALE